jgi:hypothetical protein
MADTLCPPGSKGVVLCGRASWRRLAFWVQISKKFFSDDSFVKKVLKKS